MVLGRPLLLHRLADEATELGTACRQAPNGRFTATRLRHRIAIAAELIDAGLDDPDVAARLWLALSNGG